MGEHDSGVDAAVVDHTQRLQVVLQRVPVDDRARVDEAVQGFADGGEGLDRRRVILRVNAGETRVEVSVQRSVGMCV